MKLSSLALLALAVGANVAANVSLKAAAMAARTSTRGVILGFLAQPTLYLGFAAAGVLIGAYLLALRETPMSTAYVLVTSTAMVGLVIAERLFFGGTVGAEKLAGMAFVAIGIWLLMRGS